GLVLSDVYGLGSGEAAPESFAAAIERPLMAEQLARSWRLAAGMTMEDDALRRAVIGAIPAVLPKDYNASFQQALFLDNSPALAETLKISEGSTAERLLKLENVEERIRAAFQTVLGRGPDAEEVKATSDFLNEHTGETAAEVRDLMWALMTSAEFLTMP
ncbi:MAG: hypothetical protein ACXW32_06980, partial [Limisphaerales bacterium]